MPDIPNDAVRLHCETGGSGRPVVFLHALGLDGTVWQEQVRALPPGHRWITVDLRGHGRSDASSPVTVEAMAADLRALLDDLDVSAATLVGCSMGGLVAQALAVSAPERVVAMVLCNTFARMDPAEGASRVAARKARAAAGALTPESRATVLVPDAPAASRERFVAAARRIAAEQLFAAQDAVYAFDVLDRLGAIRCPTLIVAGSDDDRTPAAMTDELLGAIPGSRLRVIEGAGHVSHLDRPEAFGDVLADFLRETERAGARA